MDLIDKPHSTKEFLFLSDFDQTLSFQDSGHVLSEALGIPDFHEKVTNLASRAVSLPICSSMIRISERSGRMT